MKNQVTTTYIEVALETSSTINCKVTILEKKENVFKFNIHGKKSERVQTYHNIRKRLSNFLGFNIQNHHITIIGDVKINNRSKYYSFIIDFNTSNNY